MARYARIVVPGQAMHIIQRGNNRQATFYAEEDYRKYLDILFDYAGECECQIHAYVLLTNHVHLLLTPQTVNSVSLLMQAVGRKYVRYINGAYQRSGTLWEGRYKSAIIDTAKYLLTCSRYIELNPVRAGMVQGARQYKWSSYRANALGMGEMEYLTPHPLYKRLGETAEKRQAAYRALFSCQIEPESLNLIREGTQKCTLIGKDRFKKEVEKMLKRRVTKLTHGGDRKSKRFLKGFEIDS